MRSLGQPLTDNAELQVSPGPPSQAHIQAGIVLDRLSWQCPDVIKSGIRFQVVGQSQIRMQLELMPGVVAILAGEGEQGQRRGAAGNLPQERITSSQFPEGIRTIRAAEFQAIVVATHQVAYLVGHNQVRWQRAQRGKWRRLQQPAKMVVVLPESGSVQ